jgi:hypothetical protein
MCNPSTASIISEIRVHFNALGALFRELERRNAPASVQAPKTTEILCSDWGFNDKDLKRRAYKLGEKEGLPMSQIWPLFRKVTGKNLENLDAEGQQAVSDYLKSRGV